MMERNELWVIEKFQVNAYPVFDIADENFHIARGRISSVTLPSFPVDESKVNVEPICESRSSEFESLAVGFSRSAPQLVCNSPLGTTSIGTDNDGIAEVVDF